MSSVLPQLCCAVPTNSPGLTSHLWRNAALYLDCAHEPDKEDVGPQDRPDAWCAGPKPRLGSVVHVVRFEGALALCSEHSFLLQAEPHGHLWMLHCLAVRSHGHVRGCFQRIPRSRASVCIKLLRQVCSGQNIHPDRSKGLSKVLAHTCSRASLFALMSRAAPDV